MHLPLDADFEFLIQQATGQVAQVEQGGFVARQLKLNEQLLLKGFAFRLDKLKVSRLLLARQVWLRGCGALSTGIFRERPIFQLVKDVLQSLVENHAEVLRRHLVGDEVVFKTHNDRLPETLLLNLFRRGLAKAEQKGTLP